MVFGPGFRFEGVGLGIAGLGGRNPNLLPVEVLKMKYHHGTNLRSACA